MNYEVFRSKEKTNSVSKKYITITQEQDKVLFEKFSQLQALTKDSQEIVKAIVLEEIDNAIKAMGGKK